METWQSVLIGLSVGGIVGVIRALCLCRKYFQELPPDEDGGED